jgi:hypothetical protein
MGLITCEGDLIAGEFAANAGDGYWYLASPYSRLDRTEAFVSAAFAAAWLIGNGVRVYSPITHSHPIAHYGGLDPLDLELWLRVDKPFMANACGMIVLQLPDWDKSAGIKAEVAEFARMGKPVHYMEWPMPA